MSNMQQLTENNRIFSSFQPLTEEDSQVLYTIADELKTTVPCTACKYCVEGCPMEINIPELLSNYNEICYSPSFNIGMRMDAIPVGKRAVDCISCGQCTHICPQRIDIPSALADFANRLEKLPKWSDICKEREKAARINNKT